MSAIPLLLDRHVLAQRFFRRGPSGAQPGSILSSPGTEEGDEGVRQADGFLEFEGLFIGVIKFLEFVTDYIALKICLRRVRTLRVSSLYFIFWGRFATQYLYVFADSIVEGSNGPRRKNFWRMLITRSAGTCSPFTRRLIRSQVAGETVITIIISKRVSASVTSIPLNKRCFSRHRAVPVVSISSRIKSRG